MQKGTTPTNVMLEATGRRCIRQNMQLIIVRARKKTIWLCA